MATRVLLVDDHPLVREGVRAILSAVGDLEVVGEAATAAEALAFVDDEPVDIAVLDVRLGEDNGIDLCRDIRSSHPEIRCLMLTTYDDDEALAQAIVAGASGYVLKQINSEALILAVRQAAAGHSLIDAETSRRVVARMHAANQEMDRINWLTDRERQILDLIAEGKTNREIGEELFIAEKTVKNYLSNLLAKLGMSRRTEAAAYAARLAERRNHKDFG